MQNFPRHTEERTGEEGFGLLFGLFAMAIVGVIGWTMVTNGLVDMTISDNYRHKSTAFFAADSGLEQSVVDMKLDDDWIQQIIDPDAWELTDPMPASITINGHTVSPTSDGAGGWVPGYYPYGDPVDIGEGTYQREIYLPPAVGSIECEDQQGDEDDASGSGSSKSKDKGSKSNDSESDDSKSNDSGSNDSGSNDSGSGSSGSGTCSPSWDDVDDDSTSGDSGSGGSESEDSGSKSNDSKSNDSGSGDSGSGSFAAAEPTLSGVFRTALHGLAGLLMPTDLLLALSDDDSSDENGAGKEYVCHIPPGNPSKAKTLHIGEPALSAHLAHGDTAGKCDGVEEEEEYTGGGLITFSVRATGTAGITETATQVLRADIELLVNPDGTVSDIRVTNWIQER